LNFRHAENSALTSDADIGALQDFGAAGASESLSGEDHRLGGPVGLEPAAEDDFGLVFESLEPFVVNDPLTEASDFGEVHPGTKGVSLTGEDGDSKRIVGVETNPSVIEATQDLCVGGVLLLWSIDGDDEDWSLGFNENKRFGHLGIPPKRFDP
jgi:hypothetical protein